MDAADALLKDRICDATARIPTSRWPFYSESKSAAILVGVIPFPEITFEAERDTLLTDLSIIVEDDAKNPLAAHVSIEYCNTDYAVETDVLEFAYCCDRKPVFLVGLRENKKLKINIALEAAAPVGGAITLVTVSGFQGDGCCS